MNGGNEQFLGTRYAKCFTPAARELMNRAAKVVHHRCGCALLTKVEACWGPSLHNKAADAVSVVHICYWDAQTRQAVFCCPGCSEELRVWWPYVL